MTSTALYFLYIILAAGAAGMYLCLPAGRAQPRRFMVAGGVLGAAAMAGFAVYLARWLGPGFQGRTFFVIFALIAVVAAVRVVTHVRPVYSAVYFVLVVLAVAGLCVLAAAEFLAAALVIVYGGAILVTYVFVIMLAQQAGEADYDAQAREPFAAVLMGFVLTAAAAQAMVAPPAAEPPVGRGPGSEVIVAIQREAAAQARTVEGTVATPIDPSRINSKAGNTHDVGRELARRHMLAVQVAGVLMLVAMAGALAIAHKRIDPQDLTPEEQAAPPEDLGRAGRTAPPF